MEIKSYRVQHPVLIVTKTILYTEVKGIKNKCAGYSLAKNITMWSFGKYPKYNYCTNVQLFDEI